MPREWKYRTQRMENRLDMDKSVEQLFKTRWKSLTGTHWNRVFFSTFQDRADYICFKHFNAITYSIAHDIAAYFICVPIRLRATQCTFRQTESCKAFQTEYKCPFLSLIVCTACDFSIFGLVYLTLIRFVCVCFFYHFNWFSFESRYFSA